jgi:hypothetical protein
LSSKVKWHQRADTSAQGVLAGLLAVAEDYPDLKASPQFQTLMRAVDSIEAQLASC